LRVHPGNCLDVHVMRASVVLPEHNLHVCEL
jgi:hypothetical protein